MSTAGMKAWDRDISEVGQDLKQHSVTLTTTCDFEKQN